MVAHACNSTLQRLRQEHSRPDWAIPQDLFCFVRSRQHYITVLVSINSTWVRCLNTPWAHVLGDLLSTWIDNGFLTSRVLTHKSLKSSFFRFKRPASLNFDLKPEKDGMKRWIWVMERVRMIGILKILHSQFPNLSQAQDESIQCLYEFGWGESV